MDKSTNYFSKNLSIFSHHNLTKSQLWKPTVCMIDVHFGPRSLSRENEREVEDRALIYLDEPTVQIERSLLFIIVFTMYSYQQQQQQPDHQQTPTISQSTGGLTSNH